MTQSHLVACASCARHVRVSEAACPFCGATLADSLRASPRPQPPGVRLTRAALFAFGTGTLALSPACSSSSPQTGPEQANMSDDASGGSDATVGVDAAYGAPGMVEDAAEYDGNSTIAAYGGAIIFDAATDDGPADAEIDGDATDGSLGMDTGDGIADGGHD